jgi:hypothetical protein
MVRDYYIRIALLMACLLSGPATAQTVEETVEFIFIGANPPQGSSIQKLSNCKFRVASKTDNFIVDFALLVEAKAAQRGPSEVHVGFLGSTSDFVRLQPSGEQLDVYVIGVKGGSADRINKAIGYFRSTFCKGRAFRMRVDEICRCTSET